MGYGQRSTSFSREVFLSSAGLVITLVATSFALADAGEGLATRVRSHDWASAAAQTIFVLIVASLSYGACVYLLARLGHLGRLRRHVPASDEALAAVHQEAAPPLVTVLVPSYMEEERVVTRTLLCAALQQYPRRRVVLLVDDPPVPRTAADAARLEAARALPATIERRLAEPRKRCAAALEAFLERVQMGALGVASEYAFLAELHRDVASWFEDQAAAWGATDHTDHLFVETTLVRPASELRAASGRFARLARDEQAQPSPERLRSAYAGLLARFEVELTSFERKRYGNLSHAPNKAMNLNSYLALLGKSFRETARNGRLFLEPAPPQDADLTVPASEFVLIVDADSVLTPDYAPRLVHVMREPGNERIAVAQTPYNAFPRAAGAVERIAGATTDIQYLIHQGFTAYGATYWVGANAVARTAALREIAATDVERGFPIVRFVHDRTVIEDTESTVDLVARGWRLHNYPDRLAYSETPPDFGSLLIQRRRWANGGLIILPKLVRYVTGRAGRRARPLQAFMMAHYLTSLSTVNLGLLVMLGFSFEDSVRTAWLPLAALPYYALYAWDLRLIGYRAADILRVYALNLVLIPVNLAGVLSSLRQATTGKKSAFGRTPKVRGRTVVPPIYLAALAAILGQWILGFGRDLVVGRPAHALLTGMNVAFMVYGVVVYVGVRNAIHDLRAGLPGRWPSTARALGCPEIAAR